MIEFTAKHCGGVLYKCGRDIESLGMRRGSGTRYIITSSPVLLLLSYYDVSRNPMGSLVDLEISEESDLGLQRRPESEIYLFSMVSGYRETEGGCVEYGDAKSVRKDLCCSCSSLHD